MVMLMALNVDKKNNIKYRGTGICGTKIIKFILYQYNIKYLNIL